MSTIQAAQQSVVNEVSKYDGPFTIGIASDKKGQYIVVGFANLPADMSKLPTSVGGYRVMYEKINAPKPL